MNKYTCRTCYANNFENWGELAEHILKYSKIKGDPHKRDRKGVQWAKRYKNRKAINKLGKIGREFAPPTALTEEQKQNKVDCRMILSGETKNVPVICPRCKTKNRGSIEVEHAENPQAWQIDNCYVIFCERCR